MNLLEQLEMLERLDKLIERKGTGTAEELAIRLGICRRSVFNYMEKLRFYGAEIAFCPTRKSFYYVEDIRPTLPILSKQNSRKIGGGKIFLNNFAGVQNFCTPTFDLCNRLISTEEGNDAGGFRYLGFGY